MKVASFVAKGLGEQGYAVDRAENLQAATSQASDNDYDLVILDVMLPDGSGFDLAQWLRENAFQGPILMLTALNQTQDKVRGLDSGADDYLAKPFALDELLARTRALLRRYGQGSSSSATRLSYQGIEMDLIQRRVLREGHELALTVKEYALLEYFLRHKERPISRSELIEHVWDMSFDPGSNVVDVYVTMLRKKLDHPFETKLLQTVVGFGYELRKK